MTRHRPNIWKSSLEAVKGIYGSYAVSMTNFLRKPVTEEYPEYRRILPERSRGRIILTRDPDGDERCVACYLCSAVCPTSCISMESAEREGNRRRYPVWFRINFARCIYCGQCEEACPTLAIQLTSEFEFSKYDVLDFVYEKEELMVDHGGRHPDYNFYRHAGVSEKGEKGTHLDEEAPVNIKTNMP